MFVYVRLQGMHLAMCWSTSHYDPCGHFFYVFYVGVCAEQQKGTSCVRCI